MKKSRIISLVLISASFSSCMDYVYTTVSAPYGNPAGDTVGVYADAPYYYNCYYGGYWHPFSWWGGHRDAYCYNNSRNNHYGPRHEVNSNVARQRARSYGARDMTRGGFGSSAHSSAGHGGFHGAAS